MTVIGSSVRTGEARRRCSAWTTVGALVAIAGAALMAAPTAVRAQSSMGASVPVSLVIPTIVNISSSGNFSFPSPTDADYTTGHVASTAGPTLTHRGNTPYVIVVAANTGSTFGFVAAAGRSDPDPGKPVGDLKLQATTGGTGSGYIAMGAAGITTQAVYTRGSKGGNLTSTVDGHLTLSYANDPPGTYTTTVVFTIIAQ